MTRHSNHGLGDGISMLGILCASQLDLLCDQPQISPDIQKMSGPFSPYLPVVVGLFAIACPFHRHRCLHYNLVAAVPERKRESTKHQKEKKQKPRNSLSQKVTKIFICLHNQYINRYQQLHQQHVLPFHRVSHHCIQVADHISQLPSLRLPQQFQRHFPLRSAFAGADGRVVGALRRFESSVDGTGRSMMGWELAK